VTELAAHQRMEPLLVKPLFQRSAQNRVFRRQQERRPVQRLGKTSPISSSHKPRTFQSPRCHYSALREAIAKSGLTRYRIAVNAVLRVSRFRSESTMRENLPGILFGVVLIIMGALTFAAVPLLVVWIPYGWLLVGWGES